VSRPTKVPACRKHAKSGQAIVTLNGVGERRDIYLGLWGSPQSHREYARVITEWTGTVAGPPQPGDGAANALSVNQLILKFWDHAQRYYVKNGRPTSEQHNYKAALKPLRLLYGLTPAAQFSPIALKALRQNFISAGLSRSALFWPG
jgi:hypothetical protein